MPRGKQLFGVANWRENLGRKGDPRINALASELVGGTCLLDGREIKQVWFADTEAGIVKTYDVLGDGKAHSGREANPWNFPFRDVECPSDGVMSETLRGKVELFAAAEVGGEDVG